jgi:hypothetical protein
MRKPVLVLLALVFLLACKSRKKTLTGEEPVEVDDFIEFFQDIKLPYTIADTQVSKRLSDSLLISAKIFRQFIPDSVMAKDFGKQSKPKFYALGKVSLKGKETYLFVKAATLSRQVAYILCLDDQKVFRAGMPIVRNNSDKNISLIGGMDNKYTITTRESRKTPGGTVYYKLNAWVYNDVGQFTLIKIESNEPVRLKQVYNPIDSLPRKNRFSGDYVQDKKNFVSVRDGKDARRILFFAHFERYGEECEGELKGEALYVKPNVAQYRHAGDPCVLELSFTNNKLTLREEQGCGNHRGIKCFFEGSYWKKKEAVVRKKK